jgi:anti-anti-sigma factor
VDAVPGPGLLEVTGVRCRRSAGAAEIEAVGELDVVTASSLLDAATSELEAGCRALVLDLAEVSFCCARGIGALTEIRRLAAGHGADVRVARASDRVRRTAELVGVRDVVDGPAGSTRCWSAIPGG